MPTPHDFASLFLFVPADRPERFDKAASAGADAIIIDLEDAVAPAAKDSARSGLATGLAGLALKVPVFLRINGNRHAMARRRPCACPSDPADCRSRPAKDRTCTGPSGHPVRARAKWRSSRWSKPRQACLRPRRSPAPATGLPSVRWTSPPISAAPIAVTPCCWHGAGSCWPRGSPAKPHRSTA
ncbi:MAG: hypothetical protein KL863_10740 [Rhizobium sp.]|nr:hypothetical protein [Rhizobium sp.]MBX9456446.1 hypothetical protein [Rhizobium sp.]